MRGCLTTLLILVVLVVGLDFGARWWATERVASEIQTQLQLAAKPDVDVSGFPFLVEAFRGEYDSISADFPPQQLGAVSGVSAVVILHDARIPFSDAISGNVNALTAASANATLSIPLTSLAAAAGLPGLTITQNGTQLTVSGTVSVLGQQIPVSADLSVGVSADGITLTSGAATAAGVQVPAELLNAVGTFLSLTIPLDGLPFRVQSGSVRVADANLVVDATVSNVSFATV
jgi:hypothetical protein